MNSRSLNLLDQGAELRSNVKPTSLSGAKTGSNSALDTMAGVLVVNSSGTRDGNRQRLLGLLPVLSGRQDPRRTKGCQQD